MREQLYQHLTMRSYREWAEHYCDTGFVPEPLRAALAVQTADFRNANRDPKKGRITKPQDVMLPQPVDRRSKGERMADIEDQFLAWSPV